VPPKRQKHHSHAIKSPVFRGATPFNILEVTTFRRNVLLPLSELKFGAMKQIHFLAASLALQP
jgi:hypothetical protein